MRITMHGATDIGQLRRVNEDSYGIIPERQALVVCDGMGGHAAGEVASGRAVETFEAYLTSTSRCEPLGGPDSAVSLPAEANELVWAVRLANRRVYMIAQSEHQMLGMGTTLVAARFIPGKIIIGHVGDSRAYRYRDGALEAMTVDHSLVAELIARKEITEEQARTFSERNIITRALGTRESVAIDVTTAATRAGDWYMLCSDGLCGVIHDEEIHLILKQNGSDAQSAIGALIAAANDAGGPDNITIGIAVVEEPGAASGDAEVTITVPETHAAAVETELECLASLFPEADDDALTGDDTDRFPIPASKRSDPES